MTRETKIGLLVGLAFIIVIGILLSDHLTSTLQPPQAPLGVAAIAVRDGIKSPGVGQVTHDKPVSVADVSPNPIVITAPEEPRREAGRAEVTILPPPANRDRVSRDVLIPDGNSQPTQNVVIAPPQTDNGQPLVHTTTPQAPTSNPLERLVNENSGELVHLVTEGVREYKVEPGDTLSSIARRYLGGDTKANRDAFLKLNPTLRNNPERLRAGETYMLPAPRENTTTVTPPTAIPVGTPTTPTTRPVTPTDNVYTTRSGDTLWRIAINQVGSHAAVDQIKDLNRDVLKGSDRIKPGMKLRLPTKSLPSSSQANSSL